LSNFADVLDFQESRQRLNEGLITLVCRGLLLTVTLTLKKNKGVLARDTNVLYLWLWLATWG